MPFLLIMYNMSIAYGVGHPQLEKRVYFLFFITLINVFIFKKQIFKHQKLALFITVVGIIPIYTSFFVYLDTKIYNVLYDVLLFIGSFCYSVYLVFIKYITLNKQMPVFLLLFYQGILCTVYTLLIFIIISLIAKGDFTYIANIFNCNETNYICVAHYYVKIIFYFLLNIVLQALIFLVVYMFSPELFAISDIFSPLFSFIAQWIRVKEKNGLKIFLYVLGYLIIALGAFIYNELIVCNFFGFNKNTWKAIDQKAYDDLYGKDTRDSFGLFEDYNVDIRESRGEESALEMILKHN
jgi:drug/metabolite transporter (DMT)-like permease